MDENVAGAIFMLVFYVLLPIVVIVVIQRRNARIQRVFEESFAPASFDTVLLHQVLHFAPYPETALAEAARVTRPQGRADLAGAVCCGVGRRKVDGRAVDLHMRSMPPRERGRKLCQVVCRSSVEVVPTFLGGTAWKRTSVAPSGRESTRHFR